MMVAMQLAIEAIERQAKLKIMSDRLIEMSKNGNNSKTVDSNNAAVRYSGLKLNNTTK